MRDLALLVAMAWTLYGLYRWRRWYEPILVLAVAQLLERPEPEPEPRLLVRDLTVRDTHWARADFPATHPLYIWPDAA
jgi:hypothetical protein